MVAHRKPWGGLPMWLCAFLLPALTLAAQPAAIATEAELALRKSGTAKGICAVLGLPAADRARFVADLAKGSQLLVYFQSPDAAEVSQVRSIAAQEGLLGRRIFVDRGPGTSIHLADNLADAVLVAPAAERSIARAELLRVLRPEGRAILPGAELVKPLPEGTDDWRYPYHGPDNNPQSTDRIARAPYLTQFLAEPKFCPSPAVTVAAGGRIFRACGHLAHRANQNAMLNTLLAINAYNGTILWKRPLSEGFMIQRNTILATPKTLYLADDKSCKLLDAATGELRDEIVSPEAATDGTVWKWMALGGNVLYALIGGEEFQAPVLRSDAPGVGGWPRANWPGFDYPDPKTAWTQGRTLLALDPKTKNVLWRHRQQELIDGRAVCMSGGRIYFLSPGKFLRCLDADAGKVVWETADAKLLQAIGPLLPQQPRWTGLSPFPYLKANDKFLFFAGPRIPRIVAVSAGDGKLLWQKEVLMSDGGAVHLLLREDALWAVGLGTEKAPYRSDEVSFRLAYDTGEVLSRFTGRRGCTVLTGAIDSLFYRAPEGTLRIDLTSGRAEHLAPMRPPCDEGVIIAGGLLHWGAWKCGCPLSLYGNISLAPAGNFNFRPKLEGSRLVVAAGDPSKVQPFEAQPGDWPTYLGNNARSGLTEVPLPRRVSKRWAYQLPGGVRPTAPIVAGGVVFLGDESGAVRALDAGSGSVRWQAYTSGPVFFPPALWQGRLYAGSADGRVYAWEAATGRPLWSFRAAPAERWIPVYGKLISTWPVAGGVVVQDGIVYAAAGIAHYDGTYVYALDAVTGKVKWCHDSSGSLCEPTGGGISLQGHLYLSAGELRFLGGGKYETARYDLATGGCLNPADDTILSQFRTAFSPYYPEYGRYMSLSHRLAGGEELVYDASYEGSQHSALALLQPLPPGAPRPVKPEARWPVFRPGEARREAVWADKSARRFQSFAVGPSMLLAAGHTGFAPSEQPFLAAVDVATGADLWREALPAPAVKGGTAIDHAGRIVAALEKGQILAFGGP
jgi:outer membrane protein assembly factor BamB